MSYNKQNIKIISCHIKHKTLIDLNQIFFMLKSELLLDIQVPSSIVKEDKEWINGLLEHNRKTKYYNQLLLKSFLFDIYRNVNSAKVKILVVYPNFHSAFNPFVSLLTSELIKDFDVSISLDLFRKKEGYYDIIHFHWPEAVFNWMIPDEEKLNELNDLISFWKERGSMIVYTRHNIKPHSRNNSKNQNGLYGIIENNSNVIVHLGTWSKNEFINNRIQNVNHVVIPHHIYECYKSPWITKERAREYFQIPLDKLVILAFGDFRNEDEKEWTLKSIAKIKNKNKLLIAPRFGNPSLLSQKEKTYCLLDDKFVKNDELPYYFNVADIVFIQRIDILNSGNLPMAFLFNKIVVGPDIGNVGEILRKTKNFVYTPRNLKTVQKAFDDAITCLNNGECNNYNYAVKHWNIKSVTNKYGKLYNQLKDIKDNLLNTYCINKI
nr:hypothetical protein [uncultured Macellibacteroides sp.]